MKVAIIGVGLIGGSLAFELREKKFANQFSGIDQSREHLQEALDLGNYRHCRKSRKWS